MNIMCELSHSKNQIWASSPIPSRLNYSSFHPISAMLSNSGIITIFLLASSCVPSSCGAALRGTAGEKVDAAQDIADEIFLPIATEAIVLNEQVVDEVDEGAIEAHMESDLLVFGRESYFLRCANEDGINPCGPGRSCHDTEDGITCEDIPSLQGCPVGCAPNSSCIKQLDSFRCVCDEGFFRSTPYVGCVKTPQSDIQL